MEHLWWFVKEFCTVVFVLGCVVVGALLVVQIGLLIFYLPAIIFKAWRNHIIEPPPRESLRDRMHRAARDNDFGTGGME